MNKIIKNWKKYLIESNSKEREEELEEIVGELKKASEMHAGQAERIQKIIDQTDNDELEEGKKRNCGCGQDPCKTYGIQEEADDVRDKYDDEVTKRNKKSMKQDALVQEGEFDLEQIIREELVVFLEKKKKSKGKKKPGLWANIKAKKDRIKAGSGEKKAKPGDKDYPETLDIDEGVDEQYLTELENDPSETVTCTEFLQREVLDEKKTAAWQRKAGKNKEGGLNAKGRKSYEKENPGSDLKAPVSAKQAKKSKGGKSAKRRKSFCARMCGMKKKNTGAKGKRDPDSRINKSLRKWDCNC